MQPVSAKIVEKVVNGVSSAGMPGMENVLERMWQEQPDLMDDLEATYEEVFTDFEMDLLLYYAVLIFLSLSEGKLRLPRIRWRRF